jgi:hypothetical protein
VSRDDDVVGGEIKTTVSFVVSRVSKENTSGGPRCQFVSGFVGEIKIPGTIEHAQIWAGHVDCLGGEADQHICGGVEPFYPLASRSRSLKK